jgi:KUP system potassium uptake protein
MAHDASSESSSKTRHLLFLSLGALGVVYGDIGTSPLYAVRECFHGPHAIAVTPANVLGVLSLIFWSLVLIISIKYLGFVLRAHNRGEGGILALMALALAARPGRRGEPRNVLVALGLLGAALLYGDGVITPAISVLSAVEGLEVAAPVLQPFVLPLTVAILVGLFLIQSRGTAGLGAVFGPVMLVWFAVLAVLGVAQIASVPSVLAGLSPLPGLDFFARNGWHGFLVLGTVFLVVTGGEALYADLGHFGPRPIRLAWFGLAMPGLLLNYLGQGALLLTRPEAAPNPFYRMAPASVLYPLIGLSTAATIIASQAVISGAFSMLATIALVVGFRSSSNLAAAYGVAVTSTMVITTLLLHVVMREVWRWSPLRAALPTALFLVLDLAFFGANVVKVPQGGWFALVIAAAVYLLMSTWKRGRELLADRLREKMTPLEEFVMETAAGAPTRVPGTAIFMTRSPTGTPPALVHNLEHNKVLHERVVLINVVTEAIPQVPKDERLEVEDLGHGFHSVSAHYGTRASWRSSAGAMVAAWTFTPTSPRSFSAGRRCLRRPVRGWPSGARSSSPSWRATPSGPRRITGSPPNGYSRSECMWSSSHDPRPYSSGTSTSISVATRSTPWTLYAVSTARSLVLRLWALPFSSTTPLFTDATFTS